MYTTSIKVKVERKDKVSPLQALVWLGGWVEVLLYSSKTTAL